MSEPAKQAQEELTEEVPDEKTLNNPVPTEEETDEIPEDLKNLIEETVTTSETTTSDSVTIDDIFSFFNSAEKKLMSEELDKEIRDLLESKKSELEDDKDGDKKLDIIREVLEKVYQDCWKAVGVDISLGQHAMGTIDKTLNNARIPEETREKLNDLVDEFGEAERVLVCTNLFGKEEFEKRERQKEEVLAAKSELENELESMDPESRGKHIIDLKNRGAELRQRLMGMDQKTAMEYVDQPSDEDAELLRKLSALTMLMQEAGGGSSHGHSHGGQPCTGHGHQQEQPHGHSHGGQPCTGHGHQQVQHQQSHGHSHGGQPCTGHGHQQHGHGHDHAH